MRCLFQTTTGPVWAGRPRHQRAVRYFGGQQQEAKGYPDHELVVLYDGRKTPSVYLRQRRTLAEVARGVRTTMPLRRIQ